MVFQTRNLFVRHRTQTINALHAHLAEHKLIASHGMPQPFIVMRCFEKLSRMIRALMLRN